jgi:hypothetical protein
MDYLSHNPGATGVSGQSGTLVTTWGDGSGTGAGGTMEIINGIEPEPMLTWMGTWSPSVQSFSSNWRELRTLYQIWMAVQFSTLRTTSCLTSLCPVAPRPPRPFTSWCSKSSDWSFLCTAIWR